MQQIEHHEAPGGLTDKELYCAARHLRAYAEQCRNKEITDFGTPCTYCPLYEECILICTNSRFNRIIDCVYSRISDLAGVTIHRCRKRPNPNARATSLEMTVGQFIGKFQKLIDHYCNFNNPSNRDVHRCQSKLLQRPCPALQQFKNDLHDETKSKINQCLNQPEQPKALEEGTQCLTGKELYCAAKHLKAYFDQCCDEEIADWGKPCRDCPQYKGCGFVRIDHVFGRISDLTGIRIPCQCRKC